MSVIVSRSAADSNPRILTEMFLLLIEDRFPWLGTDAPADGADTVEQLSELHQSLVRRVAERNQPDEP